MIQIPIALGLGGAIAFAVALGILPLSIGAWLLINGKLVAVLVALLLSCFLIKKLFG